MASQNDLEPGVLRPLADPHCHIRLLDLYPDPDKAGRVRLGVHVKDLDEMEDKYIALSYCWGSPTPGAQVRIHTYSAEVSENLNKALHWLRLHEYGNTRRSPCPPKYVWIDQLCIRQDDAAEKSAQVGLMAKIYTKATGVIVWLGEAAIDTHLAFRFLSRLGGRTHHYAVHGGPELGEILDNVLAGRPTAIDPKLSKRFHKASKKERQALANLLRRPWFTRVWIIQEIAFAAKATVHCGPFCID